LTLVYMGFAGLGCLYVVLAAFLGHATDFSSHDAGAGAAGGNGGIVGGYSGHAGHAASDTAYGVGGGGHGAVHATAPAAAGFHFPFFSPLALATLVAAIGGYGLIAKFALDAGDGASLAMAVPAALLTAYGITYAGWRLASGSRASSVIHLDGLPGTFAEVTVPIPAGGVGEAMAMAGGQRYAAPAREVDGAAVARGAMVTVVAAGTTLLVRAGTDPGRSARLTDPPGAARPDAPAAPPVDTNP